MKRLLLISMMILAFCLSVSLAEEESNRLSIAFGLFSVELPEGVLAGPNTGNALSDFRYETDGMPSIIAAHYAPLDQYEATASRRLDSYISYVFAMSGENYSETEVQEETLENGVRLRWQIMRGDALHALWFEGLAQTSAQNVAWRLAPFLGPPYCILGGAKKNNTIFHIVELKALAATRPVYRQHRQP